MRIFLEECYTIEKLAARIYLQFAGRTHYPESIRQIFLEIAEDEMEHARIIDKVIQAPGYGLVTTPGLSDEKIDEELQLAKALLFSAEHSELSACDALQLALESEAKLVEVHANQASIPGSPTLTAFFTALFQCERAHVDTLRACLDTCQPEGSLQA